MKTILISGGCGFVGRNMVKRLYQTTKDRIIFVDNLSTGTDPEHWLNLDSKQISSDVKVFGDDSRLVFFKYDFIEFLKNILSNPQWIQDQCGIDIIQFDDVFHFAAVVGGRTVIDGDPIKVALDLSIDATFFHWVTIHKPARVLYPSSSAAYPIELQSATNSVQLKESDINFDNIGKPDMTYGWAKLTGEYLARVTATKYGIHVACIRPFSGYGEDQDLAYPIPALAQRAAKKSNPIEVWGDGNQGRDFVHIDDVLDATQLALDKISDGSAVNIGSGTLTTFRSIIDLLSQIADYSPALKYLIDKPVGVHSRYADTSLAETVLGWQPKISLEEGLKRVYHAQVEKLR